MSPSAASASSTRVQVFWQPGCTSCLRTKEFLRQQGIEFESIDVINDPGGLERLSALGARSVPVVAVGDRFTLCQSFGDLVKFLDLKTTLADPLPPGQLVRKLDTVLRAASRFVVQFPPMRLHEHFGGSERTLAAISYHLFRVAQMAVEAARGSELTFEGFGELPPDTWTARDIADWGLHVRTQVLLWWERETDRTLSYEVPTYYGRRTMHDVLERTAWHTAQHCRQLAMILQTWGIAPDGPLTAEDLAGLPVPDSVWDL